MKILIQMWSDFRFWLSLYVGCQRLVWVPGTGAVMPCVRHRFHAGDCRDRSGAFTDRVPKDKKIVLVVTPHPKAGES